MRKWTIKTGNDGMGNITLEDRKTGQRLGTFDNDDGYLEIANGVKISEERWKEIEEFRKKVGLTTADW